jgi:hypothetical protein
MSQQELLRRAVEALDRAGIEYMMSGSLVSSLQGEPRSTHDIDFVAAIKPEMVPALLAAFQPPGFYLDKRSITQAIMEKSCFNLIDVLNGDKVDFRMPTKDLFDQSRFARKYQEKFADLQVFVSAPEDTILAKLRWAKISGGSEKQFTDALRVYEVQFAELDTGYLESWADRLGVSSLLKELQDRAEIV